MVNIKNLTREELEDFVTNIGEPVYRAQQIWDWIYRKHVLSFADMNNLPQGLRERMAEKAFISWPRLLKRQKAKDTIKYLLQLQDGQGIETVLLRYKAWHSLCLSTQVGCAMGCKFCASTRKGKVRDLSGAEMLDQVLFVQRELSHQGDKPITRLVLMGIGEPLDNYDNVIRFVHTAHDPAGINIGFRRITLSTCGLVPGIMKLSQEGIPVNLAVSLHAPNNGLRDKIMPINKRYPLEELLPACQKYTARIGRRITFEYTLISGINDTIRHAEELTRLLADFPCHINIIPLNPIAECNYKPSSPATTANFVKFLQTWGMSVTQRREMGQSITAACGQLRLLRGGGKKRQ
ncbi:MAG: 23S rRNA (adenine(2503)-C(2))-methyltransferase RlmN [Firmicutes bacterium]|nr:23S rRNA (adenine(2503)-C(2))-methyltransferase RlmN [Bacillota bacterium]